MKVLGGRGIYPWLLRLSCGHRLRAGAGAGVSVDGKRVVDDDEAVGRVNYIDYIIPSR